MNTENNGSRTQMARWAANTKIAKKDIDTVLIDLSIYNPKIVQMVADSKGVLYVVEYDRVSQQ